MKFIRHIGFGGLVCAGGGGWPLATAELIKVELGNEDLTRLGNEGLMKDVAVSTDMVSWKEHKTYPHYGMSISRRGIRDREHSPRSSYPSLSRIHIRIRKHAVQPDECSVEQC